MMKVYLLDDHALFCKSLEIAFKPLEIDLVSFSDINEFYSAIQRELPDIILLDIHIGEHSGFDVLDALLEKNDTLKIIFLSGFGLEDYKYKAHLAKSYGFLNKNASIEDLHHYLKEVYEGKRGLFDHQLNYEPLTQRETEILKLSAEGLKQQNIADTLGISRRTVNNHLTAINEKLNVSSTVEAIMQGIELGIIRVKNY